MKIVTPHLRAGGHPQGYLGIFLIIGTEENNKIST